MAEYTCAHRKPIPTSLHPRSPLLASMRATTLAWSLLVSMLAALTAPALVAGAQPERDHSGCPDAADASFALVAQFFDRGGFPDAASYYTGEMLRLYADAPTLGEVLPEIYPDANPADLTVTHRAIRVECGRADFATTVSLGSAGEDWYLYLVREDSGWKISAVRTQDLPDFYYELRDRLSTDPEFVTLLDQASSDDAPRITGAEQMAIMRLVTSSDATLRRYFEQQREWFEALTTEFGRQPALEFVAGDGRVRPEGAASSETPELAARVRSVGLTSVTREAAYPNCMFLSIGGVLNEEVGYLYAPAGCAPPDMSPDRFILVEPLAANWYLYKTK
jgi:hypothetical protein